MGQGPRRDGLLYWYMEEVDGSSIFSVGPCLTSCFSIDAKPLISAIYDPMSQLPNSGHSYLIVCMYVDYEDPKASIDYFTHTDKLSALLPLTIFE